MSSVIDLRNIFKTYYLGETTHEVLHGIDLVIESGEIVAIMGPSGSGKSTLMNIIGLLDRPTSGQYFLKQQEVEQLSDDQLAALRNRAMGFVFQSFFLLPRLNAMENVGLPLQYRGVASTEIHQRSLQMLEKVGMANRARHKPNQLSGGQQQRVAIARALIGNPDVILADEPTGALDTETGKEIMDLFLTINREEKATVIVVTHDPAVGALCQRVIRIQDGKL